MKIPLYVFSWTMPAMLAACVALSACAGKEHVRELNDADRAYIENMVAMHGDAGLAREASIILDSPAWLKKPPKAERDSTFLPEEMHAIFRPAEPRFPERLQQVGFVVRVRTIDGRAGMAKFYDSHWALLAFLAEDGDLRILTAVGGVTSHGRHTVSEACNKIYYTEGYYGMDSLKYLLTSELHLLHDWYASSTAERGAVTETRPRFIKDTQLDRTGAGAFLRGLEKDEFEKRENAKQLALRTERIGSAERPDWLPDSIQEHPIGKGDKPATPGDGK